MMPTDELTTDELIALLQQYPGVKVRIQEVDYRLVPVKGVELVETFSGLGKYVWIKSDD